MTNLQEAFRTALGQGRNGSTGSTSLRRKPRRIGRGPRRRPMASTASVARPLR